MTSFPERGLHVRDLTVTFRQDGRDVPAVRGIDLDVAPGRVLALVGESGSGKSASMMGLLGLLPDGARATGTATIDGRNLLGTDTATQRTRLGRDIGVVFQDPLTSLNPVHTIGRQVAEAITTHQPSLGTRATEDRTVHLLSAVGIPDAPRRLGHYPHQFSGGMRQRVMIAIALANDPSVVIADEPTTALDVTVQAQVLDLLTELCQQRATALVLVTHDLGVVASVADEVAVMYAGRIVERGAVDDVFHRSAHPYTHGLLAAVPRLDVPGFVPEPIPGSPTSATRAGPGCAFAPRCTWAVDACASTDPALAPHGAGPDSACLRADTVAGRRTERNST